MTACTRPVNPSGTPRPAPEPAPPVGSLPALARLARVLCFRQNLPGLAGLLRLRFPLCFLCPERAGARGLDGVFKLLPRALLPPVERFHILPPPRLQSTFEVSVQLTQKLTLRKLFLIKQLIPVIKPVFSRKIRGFL